MHSPNTVLIIAKRKLAGPDLPDFGGESYPEARMEAMSPAGGCPGSHVEPEEAPEPESGAELSSTEQLDEIKRLAEAIKDAVDAHAASMKGGNPHEGGKGQQKGTYGEQKALS